MNIKPKTEIIKLLMFKKGHSLRGQINAKNKVTRFTN